MASVACPSHSCVVVFLNSWWLRWLAPAIHVLLLSILFSHWFQNYLLAIAFLVRLRQQRATSVSGLRRDVWECFECAPAISGGHPAWSSDVLAIWHMWAMCGMQNVRRGLRDRSGQEHAGCWFGLRCAVSEWGGFGVGGLPPPKWIAVSAELEFVSLFGSLAEGQWLSPCVPMQTSFFLSRHWHGRHWWLGLMTRRCHYEDIRAKINIFIKRISYI